MPKKTIRLLFFADTHLGFDYPVRPRVDRRRRGQDFFDNFHRVLRHAVDGKFDLVIHGGDLFFRSRVPGKIVDLVYEPLFEFAATGIPILIVPGNHERSNLPVSLFLSHPNIHVFDRPRTFSLTIAATRIAFAGFPFERDNIRARFLSILKRTHLHTRSADIKFLCMHQTVEGAQVGPASYTFRYGKDVIRMQDLPTDCLAILSGHIHRQQILRRSDANGGSIPVIYPGSTERTSFAEKAEDKGFFEIELRQSPDSRWRISRLSFVKLPARPMVDLLVDGNLTEETLKPFLLSKLREMPADAIVRLKSNGELSPQIKAILTGRFLRENFPGTMNFQFDRSFL